jgi:hypothetical protein
MRTLLVSIFISLSVLGGSAKAEAQQTVGDILASCSTKDRQADGVIEMTRNLFCMGYLSGLFDAFVLTSEFTKKGIPAEKFRLCTPPEGLENDKVVDLALQGMRNEPDLKLPARMAAYASWRKAFQCK